jgi:hypothetical protein
LSGFALRSICNANIKMNIDQIREPMTRQAPTEIRRLNRVIRFAAIPGYNFALDSKRVIDFARAPSQFSEIGFYYDARRRIFWRSISFVSKRGQPALENAWRAGTMRIVQPRATHWSDALVTRFNKRLETGRYRTLRIAAVDVAVGGKARLQVPPQEGPECAPKPLFQWRKRLRRPEGRREPIPFVFCSPSGVPALRAPSTMR